jgi:uncharacterized PurR-regulated membrane protein YhhQ (DUF165 family)
MIYALLYVMLILMVNVGFNIVPLVPMPGGEMWPPMALAVGLVFVARDFAQRAIGHGVLGAMAVGAGLSYVMASPKIAVASMVAFAVSELVDWLVYSKSCRPLKQRILLSSAISTPIDSVVFLAMIGHLSVSGVLAMTLSKMLGAVAVYSFLNRRKSS